MNEEEYYPDEIYGTRLMISYSADQTELSSNIRAARAILNSFPEVVIEINPHSISFGHKNPEYGINIKKMAAELSAYMQLSSFSGANISMNSETSKFYYENYRKLTNMNGKQLKNSILQLTTHLSINDILDASRWILQA